MNTSSSQIWRVGSVTGVVADRVVKVWGKPGKAAGPVGLHENWSGGPLHGLRGNRARGSGKEGLAGPGLATSRVSAHCRIGVRKSFFFFKSFHNLQTILNSIQIQISVTSIHKIKYKNTSQHKGKYALA
jgi:hypothetical protein